MALCFRRTSPRPGGEAVIRSQCITSGPPKRSTTMPLPSMARSVATGTGAWRGAAARPETRRLAEGGLDGIEARLVDLLADQRRQFGFLPRRGAEFGAPFPEGAPAVGHGLQAQDRHIVDQRDRRFQDAIGEAVVAVRQPEQLLAQLAAGGQAKAADAADLVGPPALLDAALRHRGMPALMAVEIAQHSPDRIDRRIDDGAPADLNHMPPLGQEPRLSVRQIGASTRRSRPGTRHCRCHRPAPGPCRRRNRTPPSIRRRSDCRR